MKLLYPWRQISGDEMFELIDCKTNLWVAYVSYSPILMWRYEIRCINGRALISNPGKLKQEAMSSVEKLLFDDGWKFISDELKVLL